MATTALITADEFENMVDLEHTELIRGEIREMSPPGELHAWLQMELGIALGVYARTRNLGRVVGEVGILVDQDPDTVLAPDVAFVRTDRLRLQRPKQGFLRDVPDLVIEILSPRDRTSQSLEKVRKYLDAGVPVVWVIDPQRQRVMVWKSDQTVQELKPGETLDGGDVLPGFELAVAELFPQ